MHSRALLGILTTLSAFGVAWFLAGDDTADPQAAPRKAAVEHRAVTTPQPAAPDIRAELRRELRAELRAELAAELSSLREELDGIDARAAPPDEKVISKAEAEALSKAYTARRVTTYGEAIIAEPDDPEWSAQVEADLGETFALPAFHGASVVGSDCGSTLCRVDLTFDDLAARERIEEAIPSKPPFRTRGMIHSEDAESLHATVYFTRPGYPLPPVDGGT